MAEKFYTILTNIGKAKIANSGVMGSKVNFVKFKIGDSGGNYYEPTEDQKDLVRTVYEGNITDIEIDTENSNWMKINLMIPANVGGFTIREYGVFDEDENMLAIAKCAESYKPIAEDGSTKELILRMILAVSNTKNVNLELDPTLVFVTKEELDGFKNSITTQLSDMAQDRTYYCGTISGTNTYTATNNKITVYTEGLTVRVKIGTASTGASTLNINGLGAKTILDSLGNPITSGGLKAGLPYQLCYNGTNFIVLGKGGGGDATAPQVLINKKVTVDSGQIVGTMPENGSPNVALNAGQSYNLAQGHYSGGNITANSLASQTSASADASKIAAGYSAWVNGNLVNGNYDPLTLVAGDGVIYNDATILDDNTHNSSYSLGKSCTCYNHGGTVRVKYDTRVSSSSETIYSQLYVNWSPRGAARTNSSTNYVTYTEDITINAGDVIQIYFYIHTSSYHGYISNFKICCGNNYGMFV